MVVVNSNGTVPKLSIVICDGDDADDGGIVMILCCGFILIRKQAKIKIFTRMLVRGPRQAPIIKKICVQLFACLLLDN